MYDCVKPTFARCSITRGRVNASERKSTPGASSLTVRISHSQKANGLVCGLSTRKMRTPRSTQKRDDVEQRVPELAPGRALEVQRVDVLVALGRVLGVLDGAVGAGAEELRVLGDPRVVGRALEGQVERDLQAVLARGGDERVEVLERAEIGVEGGVAALRGADGPRAARRRPGRRARCCCGPCGARGRWGGSAAGRARRSRGPATYGRCVDDVAQRAGPPVAERAREELVPGREARALAVDHDLDARGRRSSRRRRPGRRRRARPAAGRAQRSIAAR